MKEWYKSHLEVSWQCSHCVPSAPPPTTHSQLREASGVSMWNHKRRKGPQGLLKSLTAFVTQGWHRRCRDSLALAECAALEQTNPCTEAQNGSKARELTCPLLLSKDSQQHRLWSSQGRRLRCRAPRNSRLFPRERIKTSSNFRCFSCAALNRTICKPPAGCDLLTWLCMFCKITTEQPGTATSVHQKLLYKTPISCVLQRGLVFPHRPGSRHCLSLKER